MCWPLKTDMDVLVYAITIAQQYQYTQVCSSYDYGHIDTWK